MEGHISFGWFPRILGPRGGGGEVCRGAPEFHMPRVMEKVTLWMYVTCEMSQPVRLAGFAGVQP